MNELTNEQIDTIQVGFQGQRIMFRSHLIFTVASLSFCY